MSPPKVDDHNVVFPPDNITVGTSHCLHGTYSKIRLLRPEFNAAVHPDCQARSSRSASV